MQHCFVIYPVKLDFNDSCLNVTSMSYIISSLVIYITCKVNVAKIRIVVIVVDKNDIIMLCVHYFVMYFMK